MPKLIVMCAPPGAGKSTLAHSMENFVYINQDSQGKAGHMTLFTEAIAKNVDIVVDRLNFVQGQRNRYLQPAKAAGYETEIRVLHENYDTCLTRCRNRFAHHETIRTEEDARSALGMFFNKYERPLKYEADKVTFVYPTHNLKLTAIICDIDNTLSDSNHRQSILDNDGGRKNWVGFFEAMDKDPVNEFCKRIVNKMRDDHVIILSSGRPDNYRNITKKWLDDNGVFHDWLFMRNRSDSRPDTVIKEIILDFEIKTRVSDILFALDDRRCIIEMLRGRGITVLDVAGPKGDF